LLIFSWILGSVCDRAAVRLRRLAGEFPLAVSFIGEPDFFRPALINARINWSLRIACQPGTPDCLAIWARSLHVYDRSSVGVIGAPAFRLDDMVGRQSLFA